MRSPGSPSSSYAHRCFHATRAVEVTKASMMRGHTRKKLVKNLRQTSKLRQSCCRGGDIIDGRHSKAPLHQHVRMVTSLTQMLLECEPAREYDVTILTFVAREGYTRWNCIFFPCGGFERWLKESARGWFGSQRLPKTLLM